MTPEQWAMIAPWLISAAVTLGILAGTHPDHPTARPVIVVWDWIRDTVERAYWRVLPARWRPEETP